MSVPSCRRVVVMFVSVLFVAVFCAPLYAGVDNDWELWTGFKFKMPVNKEVSLFAYPQLRYDQDWDNFYYQRYDVGVSYTLSPNWRVEPFYSYVEKKTTTWNQSDLFSTDLYFTQPFARNFEFENRARWEFNFDGDRQAARERVKVSVKLPDLKDVKLYASEEIIYDLSNGDFKENRAGVGIQKKFESKVSVDVAYQLTSRRQAGHWEDFDTLLVVFGYTL